MSAVEKFPILLSEAEEESSAVPPCFSDEGINVKNPSPSTGGGKEDELSFPPHSFLKAASSNSCQ